MAKNMKSYGLAEVSSSHAMASNKCERFLADVSFIVFSLFFVKNPVGNNRDNMITILHM